MCQEGCQKSVYICLFFKKNIEAATKDAEAVTGGVLIKKPFLKISQTCVGVSF